MVNVVELAQQTYGVTSDDLRVSDNESNSAQILRSSEENQQLQTLIARLTEAGLDVGEPAASKIEAPISSAHPDRNPVIDWVRRPLEREGHQVGEIEHLVGPAADYVYAIVLRDGGGAEFTYIQAGEVVRIVVDEDGTVLESTVKNQLDLSAFEDVKPKDINCKDLCEQVCNAGVGASIPECVKFCKVKGGIAGTILCNVLCNAIVNLGCAVGCDKLCSTIGG